MLGEDRGALYPRMYGNYVLLERIGTGGMSEIDLARRAVEEAAFVRFLVIKRVKTSRADDASVVRMFKDEARICAELHHSNIAQLYDFGRVGDEYYLVLEYVPGIDVRRVLNVMRERGQPVPLRVTLRICCDVLEGLHYAHTKLDAFGQPMQIVHRDVNPRNIMISTRGEVKLIDFGVAKARDRLERTQTDHVKGKFAYMAPEQMAGRDVDHRADLFALALTFHELVAGQGIFSGQNQIQIMHRVINGSFPELPSHPDLPDPTALREVHRKALALKREERYSDAETYRRDLERVADRIGGLATRQEVTEYLGRIEPALEGRLKERMTRYAGPLDIPKYDHLAETKPIERSTSDDLPLTREIERPAPVDPPSGSRSRSSRRRAAVAVAPPPGRLSAARVVGLLALVGGSGAFVALLLGVLVTIAAWKGLPLFDEAIGAAGPVSLPARHQEEPEPVLPTALAAEEVRPPPATGGTLDIRCSAKGRAIKIDGRPTEFTTNAEFGWPAGEYEIEVDGYPPKRVNLLARQQRILHFY